jgi:hypothetical protein
MYPTVISFYTNDWEYPAHAKRLEQECKNLNLNFIIEELPSYGYLQNCQQKPFFIRERLHQLKSPVLWIDVDASIFKTPDFFVNLNADISLKSQILKRTDREWHVGTMWFNYTESTIKLLDQWCSMVESYNSKVKLTGDHSDESALNSVLNENSTIKIEPLPAEYFYIDIVTGHKKDAVILHRISNSESKKQQSKQLGVWL